MDQWSVFLHQYRTERQKKYSRSNKGKIRLSNILVFLTRSLSLWLIYHSVYSYFHQYLFFCVNALKIDRYKDIMKKSGKKNSTTQMITEAKPNQNWLGQIKYSMQTPSGVTVEVGISLAILNAGPNSQAATIIISACLLVKDILWKTEIDKYFLSFITKF